MKIRFGSFWPLCLLPFPLDYLQVHFGQVLFRLSYFLWTTANSTLVKCFSSRPVFCLSCFSLDNCLCLVGQPLFQQFVIVQPLPMYNCQVLDCLQSFPVVQPSPELVRLDIAFFLGFRLPEISPKFSWAGAHWVKSKKFADKNFFVRSKCMKNQYRLVLKCNKPNPMPLLGDFGRIWANMIDFVRFWVILGE